MQPHEERVVKERLDLDTKIAALVAFSTTDMWKLISEEERNLLTEQLAYMQLYSITLAKRISKFNN